MNEPKEQADFEHPFKCRQCGAEELLAEIMIDERSSRGGGGFAPMGPYGEPGYGCSWHAIGAVPCWQCGEIHEAEWIEATLDDEVREREAEPPEPCDDY